RHLPDQTGHHEKKQCPSLQGGQIHLVVVQIRREIRTVERCGLEAQEIVERADPVVPHGRGTAEPSFPWSGDAWGKLREPTLNGQHAGGPEGPWIEAPETGFLQVDKRPSGGDGEKENGHDRISETKPHSSFPCLALAAARGRPASRERSIEA